MLDHMTGGRANAGFARGYQRRWVDVMAQQMHGIHGALPHQHDAIDAANRAAFEECFQIIKRAWTEDLLTYEGRYWRVPAGATPWKMDYTDRFGAGVVDGVVQAVGVVPKPLQKPHPPLFQPFASSERSIRWCAQEGVTAILPPLHPKPGTAPVRGLRRGVRRGRSAMASASCATWWSPTATRKRWRSGPTAAPTAVRRGSSPSASRRGWSIPPPGRAPTCSPTAGAGRIGRQRDAPARAPARPSAGALAVRLDLQRADPTRRTDALDRTVCDQSPATRHAAVTRAHTSPPRRHSVAAGGGARRERSGGHPWRAARRRRRGAGLDASTAPTERRPPIGETDRRA